MDHGYGFLLGKMTADVSYVELYNHIFKDRIQVLDCVDRQTLFHNTGLQPTIICFISIIIIPKIHMIYVYSLTNSFTFTI